MSNVSVLSRSRRLFAGLVIVGASLTTGSLTVGSAVAKPTTVTAPAVRGPQVQLNPPPPEPLPVYPVGHCDSIEPRMPGLTPPVAPVASRVIGSSVQGRPINAEYWGPLGATKTVVVVGQIHGNECSPSLMVQAVRQSPPTSFGVWLIPTLNPDGYAAHSRRNANGVDLNADGHSRSQPETQALFSLVNELRPASVIHLHSPNGFSGAFPSGTAPGSSLCRNIGALSSMRCTGEGAGSRAETWRWFLWQGLWSSYGTPGLLIELRAIAPGEVPSAQPRLPTQRVDQTRADAAAIVSLMNATFG